MIELDKLTKKDVGRWVLYTAPCGTLDVGRIKSWNDKYVFVTYECDGHWDNFEEYTGGSTNPKDLKFIEVQTRVDRIRNDDT